MPIGIREIIFILLFFVLIFGAKRIPDLARGIGSSIRNFKGSLKAGAEGDSGEADEASASRR